jgi:hypothetical protein
MNFQPELVEGELQYTGFDKLNLTTFQPETLQIKGLIRNSSTTFWFACLPVVN